MSLLPRFSVNLSLRRCLDISWLCLLAGYFAVMVYGVSTLGLRIMLPWLALGNGLIALTFAVLARRAAQEVKRVLAELR